MHIFYLYKEDKNKTLFFLNEIGALGGDRTHGLRLRKPALYPTELQARVHIISKKSAR